MIKISLVVVEGDSILMSIKLSEADLKALLITMCEKGSIANGDNINAKELVNEIASFIKKHQEIATISK